MAPKQAKGLGRGLDAMIPKSIQEDKVVAKEVSKGKMEFNSEGIGTIKLKDMQYAIVGEKLWEGLQYQYYEFTCFIF